jgi:hypothetical protein
MRTLALLVVLICATPCWGQKTPAADAAIKSAITALEARAKRVPKADAEKIAAAIAQLKRAIAPPASSPADFAKFKRIERVDIVDLKDNTEKYAQTILTIPLQVDRVYGDVTLVENRGSTVSFTAVGKGGVELNMGIFLPKTLEMPRAAGGETVVVTFACDHDLQLTALAITRP